jgi:hypothetical protein
MEIRVNQRIIKSMDPGYAYGDPDPRIMCLNQMTVPVSKHTAFSDAIETGDVHAVESLIQQHPDFVNHPDWTPLPFRLET